MSNKNDKLQKKLEKERAKFVEQAVTIEELKSQLKTLQIKQGLGEPVDVEMQESEASDKNPSKKRRRWDW